DDDPGHRGGCGLPHADGDGPSRVCRRRQRRGQPLLWSPAVANSDWRVVISGLTAGLAAFMGASFYGSASCVDATGYELYVIASAVVGGASLAGGKGSAVNAMLGAVLIVLIRQSIRTLHFDQNYEWIIIGCATIIAVVLDRTSASFTARRLARAAK